MFNAHIHASFHIGPSCTSNTNEPIFPIMNINTTLTQLSMDTCTQNLFNKCRLQITKKILISFYKAKFHNLYKDKQLSKLSYKHRKCLQLCFSYFSDQSRLLLIIIILYHRDPFNHLILLQFKMIRSILLRQISYSASQTTFDSGNQFELTLITFKRINMPYIHTERC